MTHLRDRMKREICKPSKTNNTKYRDVSQTVSYQFLTWWKNFFVKQVNLIWIRSPSPPPPQAWRNSASIETLLKGMAPRLPAVSHMILNCHRNIVFLSRGNNMADNGVWAHCSRLKAQNWGRRFLLYSIQSEYSASIILPQWGAADADIKVPSVENTELKGSPFTAYCQGSTAVHSPAFYQNISQLFSCVSCG